MRDAAISDGEPELPAAHRRLVDVLVSAHAVRDAPVAEPADEPADEPATGVRPRVRARVLTLAAAVLVLGLLIAGALAWRQVLTRPGAGEDRAAALSAAKTAVTAVMSYDYRHLDEDIATTTRYISGNFRAQYLTAMNDEVKPRAPAEKTVVTGQVLHAAVESVDGAGTQAAVLVFGQQSVTNAANSSPTLSPTQLRAVMSHVGGRWLLVSLTQLG